MSMAYKFNSYIEKDGIVYARNEPGQPFTIWLKDRPGIVGEVDDIKDGPAKIAEILNVIEGWDD